MPAGRLPYLTPPSADRKDFGAFYPMMGHGAHIPVVEVTPGDRPGARTLAPLGVTIDELPVTPERVATLVEAARVSSGGH